MDSIEYVGIDYHTKFAVATRMQKDGTILGRDKIDNKKELIRTYLSSLPKHSRVAIEATNNWYAFVEWSHDLPLDVVLVHPGKTKAIASARIKTDAIDSRVLADLLRSDFIAEAYLAPAAVRDIRELVRYRTTLARIRTHFLVRIYSVLFKNGETITAKDISGEKARKQLEKINVRSIYKKEIESCLTMCDSLQEQIDQFEKHIREQANADENTTLLMTIPGISFYSGLLITSEIGDYRRFSSSRKLCSFAGLVPSVYSSGGKTRYSGITKQGSANLRFVLLQAVPHLTRKSKRFHRLYQRVKAKHGGATARVAVCRQLLSVILSMLRTKQPFYTDR